MQRCLAAADGARQLQVVVGLAVFAHACNSPTLCSGVDPMRFQRQAQLDVFGMPDRAQQDDLMHAGLQRDPHLPVTITAQAGSRLAVERDRLQHPLCAACRQRDGGVVKRMCFEANLQGLAAHIDQHARNARTIGQAVGWLRQFGLELVEHVLVGYVAGARCLRRQERQASCQRQQACNFRCAPRTSWTRRQKWRKAEQARE